MKKNYSKITEKILKDLSDSDTKPEVPESSEAGLKKPILHKNIQKISDFIKRVKHDKINKHKKYTAIKGKGMKLDKKEYSMEEAAQLYLERAKEKTKECLDKLEKKHSEKVILKKDKFSDLKNFLAKCAYKKSKK